MKRDPKFDKVLFSQDYYDCRDEELITYQLACIQEMNLFNQTESSLDGLKQREKLMKEMFGSIGNNCYIEPPIHANFGGKNVFIGDNFYANFNLTLVDDGKITIGNNVMIGPNVSILTPVHPIDPEERKSSNNQRNMPVIIEDDVWIATGAIIFPGITIGKGAVVGAGSVVTKDVEPYTVVAGNPARLIKKIK